MMATGRPRLQCLVRSVLLLICFSILSSMVTAASDFDVLITFSKATCGSNFQPVQVKNGACGVATNVEGNTKGFAVDCDAQTPESSWKVFFYSDTTCSASETPFTGTGTQCVGNSLSSFSINCCACCITDTCNLGASNQKAVAGIVSSVIIVTIGVAGLVFYMRRWKSVRGGDYNSQKNEDEEETAI